MERRWRTSAAPGLKSGMARRPKGALPLIESHADPEFSTPNDMAGQLQFIFRDNQCELRRDAELVGHFQRGPRKRDIAHHATNRAADKFDRGGFRDAVTRRNPSFDHLMLPSGNRNLPVPPNHPRPVAGEISAAIIWNLQI